MTTQLKFFIVRGSRQPEVSDVSPGYNNMDILQSPPRLVRRSGIPSPALYPVIRVNEYTLEQVLAGEEDAKYLKLVIRRAYMKCWDIYKSSLRTRYLRHIRIKYYNPETGEYIDGTKRTYQYFKAYRRDRSLGPDNLFPGDGSGKLIIREPKPLVQLSPTGEGAFAVEEYKRYIGEVQDKLGSVITSIILNYACPYERIIFNPDKYRMQSSLGFLFGSHPILDAEKKSFTGDWLLEEHGSQIISTYEWTILDMNCNISYNYFIAPLSTLSTTDGAIKSLSQQDTDIGYKLEFRLDSTRRIYTLYPHGDLKILRDRPLLHTSDRSGRRGVDETFMVRVMPINLKRRPPTKRKIEEMKMGLPSHYTFHNFRLHFVAGFLPEKTRRNLYYDRKFMLGDFCYSINRLGQLSRKPVKLRNATKY